MHRLRRRQVLRSRQRCGGGLSRLRAWQILRHHSDRRVRVEHNLVQRTARRRFGLLLVGVEQILGVVCAAEHRALLRAQRRKPAADVGGRAAQLGGPPSAGPPALLPLSGSPANTQTAQTLPAASSAPAPKPAAAAHSTSTAADSSSTGAPTTAEGRRNYGFNV